MVETNGTAKAPSPGTRQTKIDKNHVDQAVLTEECVDDTNPSLLVVFKSRNETVQLRILESGVR